ncbi:hypothetical protein [Dickeya dadantii]|uniref:hypothetical protein n=1 Tax=Dickeya dadantii TaxID=204038 RepID=UPI003018653B
MLKEENGLNRRPIYSLPEIPYQKTNPSCFIMMDLQKKSHSVNADQSGFTGIHCMNADNWIFALPRIDRNTEHGVLHHQPAISSDHYYKTVFSLLMYRYESVIIQSTGSRFAD